VRGRLSKGLLSISPLAVFLLVYLVSSLIAGDFYKVPVSAAFLVAGVWGVAVAARWLLSGLFVTACFLSILFEKRPA